MRKEVLLPLLVSTLGLSLGFDLSFSFVILSLRYVLKGLNPDLLRLISGVLILLMALWMLAGKEIKLPSFNLPFMNLKKAHGFLGALLLGIGLAASWSPCAGPILAGIISMIVTQPNLKAYIFLIGFLLGMNLGFFALALFLTPIWNWLKRSGAKLGVVNRISGLLLALIGIWLIASIKLPSFGFNLEGLLGYNLGFGVSFLAGVLTFLSPCTLPIMPIILVGLTGLTASDVLRTELSKSTFTTSLLPPDDAWKEYRNL